MDELILTIWDALTSIIPAQYLGLVGAIVLLANSATVFMDTESTNPAMKIVKKILNVLSLNVGKNKNADAE